MADILTSPPEIVEDLKPNLDEDSASGDEFKSSNTGDFSHNGAAGDAFVTKEPEPCDEPEIELPLVKVRDSLAEHKVPSGLLTLMFWDNVKVSAAVFAVGTILLICLNTISFISVFAYLNLCILMSVWGLKMYTSIQSTLNSKPVEHPLQEWLDADLCITKEKITANVEKVTPMLEQTLKKMRAVIAFENTMATLKVVFAMYALTFIGAIMNFLTLVLWCYIGLFTLPLVYETKQKEINKCVKMAVCQTQKLVNQTLDKVQPQMKAFYEKLPPVLKSPIAKFLKLESAKTE